MHVRLNFADDIKNCTLNASRGSHTLAQKLFLWKLSMN